MDQFARLIFVVLGISPSSLFLLVNSFHHGYTCAQSRSYGTRTTVASIPSCLVLHSSFVSRREIFGGPRDTVHLASTINSGITHSFDSDNPEDSTAEGASSDNDNSPQLRQQPQIAQEHQKRAAAPAPSSAPEPTTFREAEILGLRLMQKGQHREALQTFQHALTLPGSRTDIVRTQTISGPSPVGGSAGGRTGNTIQSLDEFEYQAAYYNMACAYSCLNDETNAIENLSKAFANGFDNYSTIYVDPDLRNLMSVDEFEELMNRVDKKRKRRERNRDGASGGLFGGSSKKNAGGGLFGGGNPFKMFGGGDSGSGGK